jgi:hypothetical protein
MNYEDLDPNEQIVLQKQLEEHRKEILSMEVDEILERLVKMHDSTDVIIEGYDLVANINEGHGIAVAGLIRLRTALMDSVEWISHNLLLEDVSESEDL